MKLVSQLQIRQWRFRTQMLLADAYYRGEQVITDLGIAIPPELRGLRTLVGWPKIAVDPIAQRLNAESFRLPGATDSDSDLTDLWDENDMQAEQGLLFKDALMKGRGWTTIGSPDEPGDPAVICVESPLNIVAMWDVRTKLPKAALQTYWLDGQRHAALYSPNSTIHIGCDDNNVWSITDRDDHNFGFVPLVQIANEAESDRRDGRSEITPEIMSIVDAACRSLLGLEVSREFYSVPQKYILGVTESAFTNADGTPKKAWATYISNILGLERDEDGNLPEVGQFKAGDPGAFTKIVEMYASQFGGITGALPQELGLYTDGNPISADALDVAESRRDRYAKHKHKTYSRGLIRTMQMALRFMNKGVLPDQYKRMDVDWTPPETLNLAAVTDAIVKQVSEGIIPARSDVTLKRLGYSVIERERITQDFKSDEAQGLLNELAHSIIAKDARVDNSIATNINPALAKETPAPPVPPAVTDGTDQANPQ